MAKIPPVFSVPKVGGLIGRLNLLYSSKLYLSDWAFLKSGPTNVSKSKFPAAAFMGGVRSRRFLEKGQNLPTARNLIFHEKSGICEFRANRFHMALIHLPEGGKEPPFSGKIQSANRL